MRALVTGATSGIGRATALALHRAGHEVTGTGRNANALDELRAVGVTPLALDLSDPSKVSKALSGMAFDILINNAGMVPPPGHFCAMDERDIHAAININLTSAVMVTHAIAPAMKAQGSGHIMFTGSIAGHTPYPNMAVYAATKAALGGFAQSLRLDLANDGVRVTEIVAGRVQSELYKGVLPEDVRASLYAGGATVQPEDVAEMILAVLAMPAHVDVARFDILPTKQVVTPQVPSGKKQ